MKCFLENQNGGLTMVNAFLFLLFAGLTGLAIDVTNGYRHRTILQVTADAAAAAAVSQLPDEQAAIDAALQVAEFNMEPAIYGDVLDRSDIVIGAWNNTTRSIDTSASMADAVQITTREAAANSNPVSTFLLSVVGNSEWDIVATSTAARSVVALAEACPNAILARSAVKIEGANEFNHTCIHGNWDNNFADLDYAVSFQSDNVVDLDTSMVSMPSPTSQLHKSGNNTGLNTPYDSDDSAVKTRIHDPQIVDQLFCTRLKEKGTYQTSSSELNKVQKLTAEECKWGSPGSGLYGVLSAKNVDPAYTDQLPPWDNGRKRLTSWNECNYKRYRRYVIDGDVKLKKCGEKSGWIRDVTILATGVIEVEQDVDLRNVMLFSRYKEVKLASGNQKVGGSYCESGGASSIGNGEVYLMAHTVDMGSNIQFNGVIAVGQWAVKMGSTNNASILTRGVAIEAGEQVNMGSDNTFQSCETPLPDLFGQPATAVIPTVTSSSGSISIFVK